MGRTKENGNLSHYAAVNRSEVPQGRQGKHRKAVSDILSDVSRLGTDQAVKVPLSSLNGEKMQNLRSALNRETRQKNIPVVTSSDGKFLYVWRSDKPNPESTEQWPVATGAEKASSGQKGKPDQDFWNPARRVNRGGRS
jgi:hypothetical protein